ncbi:MAG: iron-containing alcohol dehydrogenase [Acidobacteriaceae bacterium]|nr:iron-containing alcohol dehydrogenase [Acidobacteriaceae bacterium]
MSDFGFEFATAGGIVFGRGKLAELPTLLGGLGTKALIITGRDTGRAKSLRVLLSAAGISSSVVPAHSEPTLDMVRSGALLARECSFVIGFGGGSAMDAAKAIAAIAPNSGEPLDYLEVIGAARPLENAPLPFIAIPTTAGTGAEVTRNAVLNSPEHGVKASLRNSLMLAKIALIDPDLTLDLPPAITASTGLDALTQLVEAYVSCRANPLTDLFCLEGIGRIAGALRLAFHEGGNIAARESMSWSSLLSGLALANAGLGVVHGFAAPLGGMLHAPHGALCAAVLPHGIAVNIAALQQRAYAHPALTRYGRIAAVLTGDARAQPRDGCDWIVELCGELDVVPLRSHGLKTEQIPDLVSKAAETSSMKGNPLPLTHAELTAIAERAI